MTRRTTPVPLPEGDLATTELRAAPRSRRGVTITVVIVLLLLLAAAVYAVTYAPDHYAKWRAERLGAGATAEVGAGVAVVPGDGWVVQPRVTNLVEWPPLPPLRNWEVLTGTDTGIELLSPDRGLRVELFVDPEKPEAAMARNEVLASGATLSHADAAGEIHAVVDLGDARVRVIARTTTAQPPQAGAQAPKAGEPTADPIDAYRPALSAILESLTTK